MNQQLEKVLRVLKSRHVAESTPQTELAKLSGLSRQTINKLKDDIKGYLKTAPVPSKTDLDFVDSKLVKTYVDLALSSGSDKQHFLQVMGAVAGYVLRKDTDFINDIKTPTRIIRVGLEYMKLVTQVESRKGTNGTPIHSQNRAAKYLLTELNNSTLVTSLFSRSNSFRAGAYAKSWKLTNEAELLNRRIVDLTIELVDEYNRSIVGFTHSPVHLGESLCTGKSVKPGKVDTFKAPDYFLIEVQDLAKLSMRSFIQVMSIAHPAPPSCIEVPLTNLASVDPEKGRTYNIFSRLRSSERKALGYYNYDISGGLQIISFNILTQYPLYHYKTFDDLHAAYPLIFTYGVDPSAKNALREQISADLGKSVNDVKALLTAYSNGSQKKVGNSAKLKAFFDESDRLRREVVATVANYKPELLKSAVEQSKHDFPEDTDWQSIEKEGNGQEARDKASVFFFIWTYFEKQIRDAMLSIVDDGIPLHDAIYSRQELAFEVFEKAIMAQTEFEVRISD
jgi:DNA-binding XRE family transcriptional regulator